MTRRQLKKYLKTIVRKCNREAEESDKRGDTKLADELWATASHALNAIDQLKIEE